jgi:hypothetical protein
MSNSHLTYQESPQQLITKKFNCMPPTPQTMILTHHKSSMKIKHVHLNQTTTMQFHHMTLVNTKHAAGTELPSLRAAFNMEAVQSNKKKP